MGAKEDSVEKEFAALEQSVKDILGAAFEDGAASVPTDPPAGTFTQADIDKAVKIVQDQLDAETAKDEADEALLAKAQSVIDQIKAALA